MIPRIIHQTWKGEELPEKAAPFAETWSKFNPSWRRILWTDRMLLEFVLENYPHLFELFTSYTNGVSRADAARYMLLHKFGGLYADIDVECMAPLNMIENETRVVLCHEPPIHWSDHAPYRSHPFIIFNGVMASPPEHPFWKHVLDRLPETRFATEIMDIAGPCFLTGLYLGFEDKKSVALHNCQLFTPTDSHGRKCALYGHETPSPLTRHDWHGSWWIPREPKQNFRRSLKARFRRLRHELFRGPVLDQKKALQQIDLDIVNRPPPAGDRIAILVPVRDAIGDIEHFVKAISSLNIPKRSTKIVFCEGDSRDGTLILLRKIAEELRAHYRDVVLLKKDVGTRIFRDRRWDKKLQRSRRAGIAAVRNHLIDHGIDETDDWALWIDVDMWKFPPDLFQTLRSTGARIVTPNCVTVANGKSYDLNAFVTIWNYPRHFYYKNVSDGLFQPPSRARGRIHLDAVRHSERVELDAVGGTTLLVDASLHRAGLRFPEIPYKDLIETEAFGLLAKDIGVRAVGLPRVEVFHVP